MILVEFWLYYENYRIYFSYRIVLFLMKVINILIWFMLYKFIIVFCMNIERL